jgi:hypothetical protein
MRKKLFLIMLIFGIIGPLKSQLLQFEIANNYLHANEWNKAIQTYNFSRPFLSEPQPLFRLGLNFSATYLFTNEKKLNHGIGLGYSYYNSYALNDSFSNSLLLNFLSINYVLQWKAKQTEGGLYSEMNLSIKSSGLFRRVNDEAFLVDESVSKAFGLGGDLGLKVGYMLPSKRRSGLAFFFRSRHLSLLLVAKYRRCDQSNIRTRHKIMDQYSTFQRWNLHSLQKSIE